MRAANSVLASLLALGCGEAFTLTPAPAGGAGGGGADACPSNGIGKVTDDYGDDSLSPLWSTWGTNIVESNGTANIGFAPNGYSDSGAYLVEPRDLRGCSVVLEVVEYPMLGGSIDVTLDVHQSGSDVMRISLDTGNLLVFGASAGGVEIAPTKTLQFAPAQHRWWAIRESSGTVRMETSPNGVSWTERYSFATPAYASAVKAEFYAAANATGSSPGWFRVDNFNLPP